MTASPWTQDSTHTRKGKTASRAPDTTDASSIDMLVDHWIRRLETPSTPESPPSKRADSATRSTTAARAATPTTDAHPASEPAARPRDESSPTLPFVSHAGAFEHYGTIGARGPLTPEVPRGEGGLDDPTARAFLFVAHWFGAPFDWVRVSEEPGDPLRWGVLRFDLDDLPHVLMDWRASSPDAYARHVASSGLDAHLDPEERPRLILVRDGERIGDPDTLERTLHEDRRLWTAIALMARDADVRRAQFRVAIDRHVRPAIQCLRDAQGQPRGAEANGQDVRLLAAAITMERMLGRRAVEALGRTPGASPDEALHRFAQVLVRGRHADASHAVERIRTSMELD